VAGVLDGLRLELALVAGELGAVELGQAGEDPDAVLQ
jgi:hypothetical protein